MFDTSDSEKRAQERQESDARIWYNTFGRRAFSWLGGRFSLRDLTEKTFANFDTSRQPQALEMVQVFADTLTGSCILHGAFGTGKTHLLAGLCNDLLSRQIACLFTTAPNLFAAIQSYIANSEDYSHLIDKAIRAPLLIIDDVDKAKRSDFREEIYFEIIDARVNAHRPIALSTNRLSELDQFMGGACVSRLAIGQIAIEMTGTDYRMEL